MKALLKRCLVSLLVICFMISCMPAFARDIQINGYGITCYGSTAMYAEPGWSARAIANLPAFATLDYLCESAEDSSGTPWFYMMYDGYMGWVCASDVRLYDVEGDWYGNAWFIGNSCTIKATGGDSNIRNWASLDAAKQGLLPAGASAVYNGDAMPDDRGVLWYSISYNGVRGWVSSMYTSMVCS